MKNHVNIISHSKRRWCQRVKATQSIYSLTKWVKEIKLFCWKGSLKNEIGSQWHRRKKKKWNKKKRENFFFNRLLILIFRFLSFTVHFMQIDTQYWTTIAKSLHPFFGIIQFGGCFYVKRRKKKLFSPLNRTKDFLMSHNLQDDDHKIFFARWCEDLYGFLVIFLRIPSSFQMSLYVLLCFFNKKKRPHYVHIRKVSFIYSVTPM